MVQDLTRELKRATQWAAISMAALLAFGTVTAAAQDADTVRPASIHAGTCDSPGDVVAELNPLTVTFDDDNDDDGNGGASGGATSSTGDDADDGTTGDDAVGDDDTDDIGDDNGDDDTDDVGNRLAGIQAFQSSGSVDFVGANDASIVEGSEDSDAGTNLEALLAEPHIVAVFESDGSDTIIACGSIGGFASADDSDLAIGLRGQNGSGFAGIAILDDDDDDDDLDVDVYIARDVT